MKIALVILHPDPTRGGAERYTFDLATALARRGDDVTLISSADRPQDEGTIDDAAAPFKRLHLKGGGLTRTRRYRRFIDSLDAHLSTTSYDVVHAMLPVRRCDLYHPHAGVAASELRKANAIFNPRRRAMAEVEAALINGPASPTVITLSGYVERNVRQFYPAAKTATLFNAVDLGKFDPAKRPAAGTAIRERFKIPADDVVALIVAQDFERKGLTEAIEAVAVADDPRLRLLVVGKESPRPYERLAARLGVGPRVTFAGRTDDPYAFYRAADFFVLPTRHDPCSLVVLEALAMGLPVISTTANGATEIMTDGEHGFVLPDPRDVPALAGAMARLIDRDSRSRMSTACAALRPRLSYETHLQTLMRIYEGVQCPG